MVYVAPAARRRFSDTIWPVLTIRTRGRLPHWEANGATYFVTFRLADSLPRNVLRSYEFERKNIIDTAHAMSRELSPSERRRLSELFSEKIESRLNSGAGSCALANDRVARIVTGTLSHFDGIRYDIFAWCVMPNHVHVVVKPIRDITLSKIVQTWKSYSGKRANEILNRSAAFWQREYYDHLVRNEGQFNQLVKYVLDNPGKAGLIDWPWVGRGFDLVGGANARTAGEPPALRNTASRISFVGS